ncbi:hypothetical protein L1987_47499 [Smallanthus sonchifolius]|uniref:Uncharacterized protein n=1 Tax=Smallanthus sonchifolius TaxID=185202 RepID=A0ACB9G2L9_9ASTR|nr:hypothetical protein L1987_47499 [Smallanthus sonchifolius]
MLFKKEFEHRCRLSKSTSSLGPIENASESKDPNINYTDKNIQSWGGHDNYSNVDVFFGVKDIRNFISDDTFLVKDSNEDIYSIYFDIENHIFEIDNDHSFCSELESSFYRNSSYLNNGSKSRIELSIDPGTWKPMDEDMVSLDPIEFHSEEEPYKNRIDSYQRMTGLTEAVQTDIHLAKYGISGFRRKILMSPENAIMFWKTDDDGNMGGLGGEADAHPYVSFTINLI